MTMITEGWHKTKGAVFEDFFGVQVPSHYGSPEQEYSNIRNKVALRDVSYFAKTRITGKDANMFLHRMVSSDIKTLEPGRGVWSLFLDIKGHIQGDFKLYAFPDHLLMVTQHYVRDRVVQGLDRYVISEQVNFTDVTQQLAMFQLLGPEAESFLTAQGAAIPDTAYSWSSVRLAGVEATLIRLGSVFAVLCPAEQAAVFLDRIDLPLAGMRAFEVYRIEQGLPLLLKDVEENNFPQECRMDAALNFYKGCYLGQEVMARIDAQGHVNKFLMGIVSEGQLQPGDKLYGGEKEVGKLTSVTRSPGLNKTVALGYVRREFAEEGRELSAGDHRTTVIVKKLPISV